MKKIYALIIIAFSLLAVGACAKTTSNNSNSTVYKEETEIKILTPSGSPALAQMYLQSEALDRNYKVDVVQGADPLAAAFTSKSYDFIYAPINLGAKLYLNNQNYKLLSIVVYCNYYLVYKGEEDLTIKDLENKNIVLFGQGAVSSILANMIFEENDLDTSKMSISYVNAVSDAQGELIKDNSLVVLSSEPSLSVLMSKVAGLKTISLYDEYQKINANTAMPQAGLFVRSDINKDVATRYLNGLKESALKVTTDIEASSTLGSVLYTTFSKEVIASSIPRSEIKINSTSMKEECDIFFDILNQYNSKILGGTVDEGFYFK